jgi:hypothetical protein
VRRPTTEEISGLIERVTFHNSENGFCVLRVKTPRHREETTVIGSRMKSDEKKAFVKHWLTSC